MVQSDSLHLFHLYLPGGRPSFFHDITDDIKTPEQVAHCELHAFYGRDPSPPDVAKFRKDLHGRVSLAVRRECADEGFPFRFALSSGAFLAGFLAFSLLFRFTPLPFKLVAAIIIGIATYRAILGKYCGTQAVKDRSEALCARLDAVVFRESAFVVGVEELMDDYSRMSRDEMMQNALIGDKQVESDSELGPALCRFIEQRRRSRIPERLFKRLVRSKRLSKRDWKLVQSRCDDTFFPRELLALSVYLKLHHNYSDVTCSSKRIDSSSR